jgi:hypothetical protein
MAETWGNPEKKIVVAAEPVMNGTVQASDKYITSALKFNIRFDGAQRATWVFCTTAPQAGEEIEVVQLTSGEFKSYWTTAAKELKTKPKGGGFGGGAKPNYSLEQEAMRDGQRAAIEAIRGGLIGKDGKPMENTWENIRKVASVAAKDIIDAKA